MFKQSLITSFSSTKTWDMVCVCTCICVICTEGGTLFWSKNIYKQGMETNWDGMVIAKIYGDSPVPVYNFWHGGLPGLPHSMNNQSQRDDKDTKCCWIILKISFIYPWWELERLSCNPEDCLFNVYPVAPNGDFPVENLGCFPWG